jgi:acyl-CoA synthetase (AMP-forming)/AMP-acid ligase II
VDAVRLAREGVVAAGAREIVSVGTPVPGVDVEVRAGDGAPAGELRLGRIFVRGPSLMAGYLGDEEGTRRVLQRGWLDTGDLGFVAEGELYVHGRAKDVVVVRGANHAPEEFETALAGVRGLRPGCAVAVGFMPPGGEGEILAILAERARHGRHGPDRARGAAGVEDRVRRAVLERTGIAPHTVRILEPGTLPRTSSGKLRRGEALRRLLAGTLAPPRSAGALRVALEAARSGLAYARLRRRGGA